MLPLVASNIETGKIEFTEEDKIQSYQKGNQGKIYYRVDDTEYEYYILGKNTDALKFFLGLMDENPGSITMMACMIDTMPNVWKMEKYSAILKYFANTLEIDDKKIINLAKRPVILISINNDKIKGTGTYSKQYHECCDNFTRVMELKNLIIYRNSQICKGLSEVKAPTFDFFADIIRSLSADGKLTGDLDQKLTDLRGFFDLLETLYKDA